MIDLKAVTQLVEFGQTRAIGDALHYAARFMDGDRTVRDVIAAVMRDIEESGLGVLDSRPVGDYAAFRGLELGAALNRLRTLRVRQGDGS